MSPGAIDNHIVGIMHIVAMQESAEFLQHGYITRHFFVTHFRGCAALFNMHTFEQDIEVKATHFATDMAYFSEQLGPPFPELDFGEPPETANRSSR